MGLFNKKKNGEVDPLKEQAVLFERLIEIHLDRIGVAKNVEIQDVEESLSNIDELANELTKYTNVMREKIANREIGKESEDDKFSLDMMSSNVMKSLSPWFLKMFHNLALLEKNCVSYLTKEESTK